MYIEILYSIGLLALFVGSITDFKTREVPDWVSYGLIFAALFSRAILAAIYSDWSILLEGMYGFGVFVAIAFIMFYAGQWGGGDSKLLMGLGAVFGLSFGWDTALLGFWINTLLIGSIYGLLFSGYSAYKNKTAFIKDWNSRIKEHLNIKRICIIGSIIVAIAGILVHDLIMTITLIVLASMILLGFYLFMFIRSVEKTCMQKKVDPEKLTEGDWIVNDIKVDGKYVAGPKDLGIEQDQIDKLIKFKAEGKIHKILIKEGIPFVPSFFLAFIIQWIWGNILFIFF